MRGALVGSGLRIFVSYRNIALAQRISYHSECCLTINSMGTVAVPEPVW